MRKQVTRYFRKSLCGMLSAAMIATSLIAPNMTVYAAPQDEAGIATENEEDKLVEDTAGENETGDESQGSGLEESGEGSVGDKESADDGDASSETGDNAGEDDKENPDDVANPEDGDDVKDEEAAADEVELEEVPEAVMAASAADARSSDEMPFYFYYKPEEDEADGVELAVDVWSNGEGASITSSASMASWNNKYYSMESVEGYSNWYTIGLTISDKGFEENNAISNAGFDIYRKGKETKLGGFSKWSDGNPKIYEELLGANIESYAVKDWKGYANDGTTDLATAIMRQVTLYVYDAENTPHLQMFGTVADTLSKVVVDSETEKASLEELTSTTVDDKTGYALEPYTGHNNWYSITFSAPGKFEFNNEERICGLYSGNANGGWKTNFINGAPKEGETWNTDFTPVFAGKAYYKGDTFSDKIEDETQAEGDITFYYYLGDATDGEEVGLYCQDGSVTVKDTTVNKEANWTVNTSDKVYLLEKVKGYAGWYSIPIHVEDVDQKSGFAIYVKSASGTPKVEYDGTNNKETYDQIVSGKNKTCAYKEGISYIGTDATTNVDKVAAIMRNVTVNIYSEDVIPVIQLDKESAAKALYKVDETNGSISPITSSGDDGSDSKNPVYDMEKMQDAENWYTLSFSVPGAISFDKKKICGLYGKSGDQYSWLQDLANGYTESNKTWEFDFTPVFDGKIWCKYEHSTKQEERELTFYANQDEAEAVTLAQLNELLNSDEVKAIVAKGEAGGYTEDSWSAFKETKTWAEEVAEESKEEGKDPTEISSDEIKKCYNELKRVIEALKSLDADVTFYYYAGETEDEIGLYYWDKETSKGNISSTNEKAKWSVWGEGDTYLMTKVEGYAGWYSIPINFKNSGTDAGFQVYTKTKASSTEDNYEYKCDAGDDGHKDVYQKLVSGNYDTCAVKNGMAYVHATKDKNSNMVAAIMRQVTLHVYDAVDTPYLHMGKTEAPKTLSIVNETTGTLEPLKSTEMGGENAYALQPDAEYKNWYEITFSAPGTLEFDSKKICNLYTKVSQDVVYDWAKDFMNGSEDAYGLDFTPVFAGKTYYKDGTFYATLDEADPDAKLSLLDKLRILVEEAKEYKQKDYKEKGWKEFTDARAAAEAVVKEADDAESGETGNTEGPTDEKIQKAYDDLVAAIEALIPASIVEGAAIKVTKVPLDKDFIMGADISSYYALKESGVEFKDENGKPLSDQGFFNYLYDEGNGMNWARIRIWNDPYNSSGKGYGGGNNDLEKAKIIGKWASNAGMKVLIDFHYSDFWADPAKQKAPKAWAGYNLEQKRKAVYDYTLESLNALKSAGVTNIGMVQVGNETNNGICGETNKDNMAVLFNAGSEAVKAFDEECLVAVHFTNPQDGYASIAKWLDDKNVKYDVFASSYYPFGHGNAENLKKVLKEVADKYNKKVMVAETSWPTTLIDGDGYGYVSRDVPKAYEDQDYGVSVQGQADEMQELISEVNVINKDKPGTLLGVFYWEPAWISPYYIKDDEGNDIESLYKQNFELWEKYGSGWASSYAAEYDPEDAGVWYGGSAMDNSSWFDFDGTALPTAKIYSLIRSGAEAEKRIATVESTFTLELPVGTDIPWPATVGAKYNDGEEATLPVTWDKDEQELVDPYKVGEYTVHGVASDNLSEHSTGDYRITLKIKVVRKTSSNILKDPSFEEAKFDETLGIISENWNVNVEYGNYYENEGDTVQKPAVKIDTETPHNTIEGAKPQELHFYSKDTFKFTVSQTIEPEAGTYIFGGYIQGGGADIEDVQYAYVQVLDKNKNKKSRQQTEFSLNGWKNWSNPEITGISVEEGESIEVGLIIKSTKESAWGSIDDLYLYGTHTVSIDPEIENGSVTANVVKADSGENVILTVTADSGYYPETLTVSGASVEAGTLTSSNGTVDYKAAEKQAVLTYAAKNAEEKSETFTMPKGNVTVSATFASVFEADKKISLDAMGKDGKYLVQVNGSGEEQPIEDQFNTGKSITPAVELSYMGYKLSTKDDYEIKYDDNKAEGTAKITLKAKSGDKTKFEGTRVINFNIVPDTREEFKNLKVTFKSPDKGDGSTPAKSIYYLGKQKELTPEIVLKDSAGEEKPNPKDKPIYKVFYHNNKKIGKATVVVLPTDEGLKKYKEGSVTTTFTIAKCPVNYGKVSVEIPQPNQYYTGKKVEPAVTVKLTYTDNNGVEKTTTLMKGTDYTIAYSNNTNATQYAVYKTDSEGNPTTEYVNIPNKVATIKITGKGNFTGTRTTLDVTPDGKAVDNTKLTFVIRPKSIENATITAADLAESTSGAVPKLTVKDGTKAVASSQYMITKIVKKGANGSGDTTVYTYEQTDEGKKKATTGSNKLKEAGTYEVTVAGKNRGNYTGENTVHFEVKDKEHLISNAKITVKGKFYFTGNRIELNTVGENPELKVVAGSGTGAKTLTEGNDYTVKYENNINAGKATVTITGKGEYVGKKTTTFTIGKRALATGFKAGNEDKEKLTKGLIQTTVLSKKNIETKLDGTWNGTGDVTEDTDYTELIDRDTHKVGTLSIPYTGYTLNPEFTFSVKNYIGEEKEEGKEEVKDKTFTHELSSGDYTVTYSVGKWEETKDEAGNVVKTAPVTATVKGKGNYSGSVKIENMFTLTARDLRQLNIEVTPTSYNGGKALMPSVKFSKLDGTVVDLKLGTAYTVTYKNNKLARLFGLNVDKDPKVTVKVKGNGWIIDKTNKDTETASKSRDLFFNIDQQEIVKTDVADIAIQTYKGKALTPAVTIKVNGKKLKAGTDYTVTYSNNIKRSGTTIGTVTIVGKGNYFTRTPITKTFVIK